MKSLLTHATWALVLCCVPTLSQAQNFAIPLRSFEEVPSISSGARGMFLARIADGTIAYRLSYDGLQGDVQQAHIHIGQKGVNGGVSAFLCQTAASPDPVGLAPTCPSSGEVTGLLLPANVIGPSGQGITPGEFAELVAAIRKGVAYVNVHSSQFPAGEIRGQFGHGLHHWWH